MDTPVSNFLNTVIPFAIVVNNIDPNCTFYQELEFGQVYYVFNKEYPKNYSAKAACQWTAVSPVNSKILLSCGDISMPKSLNCFQDRIEISSSENDYHKYCGNGKFSFVSTQNTLNLVLRSTAWSKGGRFLCTVVAVDIPKNETSNNFQKPITDTPCTCGWKNDKRIYGGHETKVNEYPAMAALIVNRQPSVYCGATIISETYVLTAAHCVVDINASSISVLVGDHDVTVGTDTSSSALYQARQIIIHPNYNSNGFYNDLALIRVSNIVFSENVGPACLPFKYTAETFTGQAVTLLGWGQLAFDEPNSNTLQEANVGVITNLDCQQEYSGLISSQICTFNFDMDSCNHDSGGPAFWQNQYNKRLYLVGIISYGKACGILAPAVNTRVTSFWEWIVVSTGQNFCMV